MGLVPKTTKSEVKFFGGLTMPKIMGLFVSAGAGVVFGRSFGSFGQIILSIVFIVIFYILTGKAPNNPKIKFISGLGGFFAYIFRKKKFYGNDSEEYHYYLDTLKAKEEKRNAKKRGKGKAFQPDETKETATDR